MSTLKSLRLDDFVIKSIETLADTNNISFNKQIGIVIKEYVDKIKDSDKWIEGEIYYPIHLTNEELILIMNEFLSNFNDSHNCTVKFRKDCGGKGVEFQVNFYPEYKLQANKRKRYNFTISANWELENIFVHWVEENNVTRKLTWNMCKRMTNVKIYTLYNIVEENGSHKNIPELNPVFKDDGWKVLFERKYPVLTVV